LGGSGKKRRPAETDEGNPKSLENYSDKDPGAHVKEGDTGPEVEKVVTIVPGRKRYIVRKEERVIEGGESILRRQQLPITGNGGGVTKHDGKSSGHHQIMLETSGGKGGLEKTKRRIPSQAVKEGTLKRVKTKKGGKALGKRRKGKKEKMVTE